MSLEVYKQLNEELINKVTELKACVTMLEQQLIVANGNYFEERQNRVVIEQKFKHIIKKMSQSMKQMCENAIYELNDYDCDINPTTPIEKQPISQTVTMRRSSSMGVTSRSPLKSPNSPQQNNIESSDDVQQPQLQSQTHPPPIIEEANNNSNESSSLASAASNLCGLETSMATIIENAQSHNQNSSSSFQSVDTSITINSEDNAMPADGESFVPSIYVNNRRATQVWCREPVLDRGTTAAASSTPAASSTLTASSTDIGSPISIPSPNTANSSNCLDRLTADFSKNMCLNSTPISTEKSSPTITSKTTNGTTPNNENSTLTASLSSRPRRQCAPKILIEPSLIAKIRNEDKAAEKRKTKKNKKNK